MELNTELNLIAALEGSQWQEAKRQASAAGLQQPEAARGLTRLVDALSQQDWAAAFWCIERELQPSERLRRRVMALITRPLQRAHPPTPLLAAASLYRASLDPTLPTLQRALQRAKTSLDTLPQALLTAAHQAYQQQTSAHPQDPSPWFQLARCGDGSQAALRAMQLAPSWCAAARLATERTANTDAADRALQLVEACIHANPGQAWPHAFAARLHTGQRRFDQALASYQQGITFNPEDEDLLEAGRILLTASERWQELVDHLLAMCNHTQVSAKLAGYHQQMGEVVSRQLTEPAQGAELLRRAAWYRDLQAVTSWHWEQLQMAPDDPATLDLVLGHLAANKQWSDLAIFLFDHTETVAQEQLPPLYHQLLEAIASHDLAAPWDRFLGVLRGEIDRCRDPTIRGQLDALLRVASAAAELDAEPLGELVEVPRTSPAMLAAAAGGTLLLSLLLLAAIWWVKVPG